MTLNVSPCWALIHQLTAPSMVRTKRFDKFIAIDTILVPMYYRRITIN